MAVVVAAVDEVNDDVEPLAVETLLGLMAEVEDIHGCNQHMMGYTRYYLMNPVKVKIDEKMN